MTATRIIAYAPNGASLGPLPSPQDVSLGLPLNDVGALTLNYAPDAPRVTLLGQPVELAVEVSWDGGLTWQEPASGRFMYLRDGRDPIKTGDAFQVEAAAYVLRLQKALVGFTGLNGEGNREFLNAKPGAILLALWDEAQARGALTGMTATWTATQDSAGTPWPENIGQVAYEPGKDLLAILQEMADQGLVDYRTQGRSVQVYVAEHASGMAADRTTGASPVSLRFGRDLTEAPFRRTWEGLADTALVRGDNGSNLERTNAGAITPWGRWETYVTASGVEDTGTLTVIADAALAMTERERTEHTFGLDFRAAAHLPFRDYAPGEWVYAAVDGQAPQRMRVRQVTLTRDETGQVGGNVVLNDRFLEADVLQARRLQKLTQGATQGGTGTTPGTSPGQGPDILAPAQPTGLNGTSQAYVESDGRVRSQITLDWNDVTTNADGSVASDVDHYEVQGRWVGITQWKALGETDLSTWSNSPYDPGEDWEFRVRAVDTVFNRGAWSTSAAVTTSGDDVGPFKPSAPTATTRMGTGRVTWDGLRATGAAMDPDFSHVTVHLSQVNGFAADASNQVNELGAAGYVVVGPLDYEATYYARLLPWDTSGNPGTPSDQVTLVVAPLVDVSNFPDDAMEDLYARTGHFINVTTDMLEANSVTADKVEFGAIRTEHLAIYSRQNSVLPNPFMERVSPAFPDRPDFWDPWYMTSASIGNNTDTPISGTNSLRVTMAAGGSAAFGNGNGGLGPYPVVPGQKWAIRAAFRASVDVPANKVLLRFQTSTDASDPWNVGDPNVAWQGTSNDALIPAGTVFHLEGAFTVPTDHTEMALGIGVEDLGVAFTLDVDSAEVFPATGDGQITEVGAGKIKTGLLQATERIVAGALSGARAELNGLGFQAFNAAGDKTFEVLGASGEAFFAGRITTQATGANGRVTIDAANNPYQSDQLWASLSFHSNNPAWDPALLWAVYGTGDPNWGTLSIRGPKLGTRQPAAIDLRSEEQTNETEIHLNANIITTLAETHLFGDPGTDIVTIKQNYTGSSTNQGFSFRSPGNKRIDFVFGGVGLNQIRSQDEVGGWERLDIDFADLFLNAKSATGEMELGGAEQQGDQIAWRRAQTNMALVWSGGSPGPLRVMTWNGSGHNPAVASAWNTSSDERQKRNARPARDFDQFVTGKKIGGRKAHQIATPSVARTMTVLDKVRALEVYDYETDQGAPRVTGVDEPEGFTQRGLMAQDVAELWPDAVMDDGVGNAGASLDLYYLLSTLWAAFQELADEVDTLKSAQAPRKP